MIFLIYDMYDRIELNRIQYEYDMHYSNMWEVAVSIINSLPHLQYILI